MAVGTDELARTKPDEIALADVRTDLTWPGVDDVLNRIANALADQDLGEHRRVAVFAENAIEVILAHVGSILAGGSTVPISFHLTADELSYILDDSASRVIFVGPETVERGLEAAARTGVDQVIGWRCEPATGLIMWDDWLADSSSAPPRTDLAARPHLHYTSGTTGFPKGTETPPAMYIGGATVAEQYELIKESPILSSGRLGLVIAPLYHTGPLSGARGLLGGNRSVILGRFDAEEVLAAIDKYRIGSVFMVPTHFQRLLALPVEVRERYDVSSLTLVTHTGSACPIDVKREMIDWFGPILMEAYGATEAGTTNMIMSDEWLERPGSVGKTLPAFELLVVNDDGQRLGPGEVGHLYFRDKTGRGIVYHNDADATAEAHLEPGVFTMGEIGYADDDGYVFITDRAKDMVVSGGVNLYPAEPEQVLADHPAVRDVAVIGVPDDDLGEQLKALVVAADSTEPPTEDELIAFCRESLARLKCPRSVDFVDDLGRNAMGKVNKRRLRAPYWPTDRTIG